MNFHQRSYSEQPQPLRPQQSTSFANTNGNTSNNNTSNNNNGNNNNGNNNNNGSNNNSTIYNQANSNGASTLMDAATTREPSVGGEILHSDSQQSLDRLFNPTNVPSYTPLRDRNLPASFFNPPWKATTIERDEDNGERETRENPVSLHSRSVSFDQRNKVSHRRANNLHMRTQSTLAPMTSLMGQASAITESSPSLTSGASSNGHLNLDFGSTEFISSPLSYGLHRSTEFVAPIQDHSSAQPQQHHQNQFIHRNEQGHQPFVANQATTVHAHHNNIHQQPVTTYNHDGHFVDSQYNQQSLNNNTMNNHHIQHNEPKFHVAHSTYVTPVSVIQNSQHQQQLTSSATVVPPFNTSNQLCTAIDGFSSSGSTVSHSCSNSDFHSGSCSSLHSRSQSCQSSVLDSSMSNLGINGSSSDLTRDSTVTPMFDYASTTPVVQHQPTLPNGGIYNQQAQQQQMFDAQTAMSHHHLFQNPLPGLHQQHAPIEERRCGY